MLANPRQTADDLAEWIRRYFEENGPKCSAVVGLAGGKDSTVTAALCVKALGAGRVVGVLMPDGVQADIEDAREIARVLGIRIVEVNIHAAVEGLRGALEASPGLLELSGTDGLTRDAAINMPARIRMTTLYAVGQMLPQGGRVANTCNLSEDWVGYSTKYGDAAGDFSPLSHLLVHEVRQIGHALGLPGSLVDKTPSDGLSGSTDEERLGFTYAAPAVVNKVRTQVAYDIMLNNSAIAAALVELEDKDFIPNSRKANEDARVIVCKTLDELGIEYLDSQTNFIFMNLKAPLKPFQDRMKAENILVGRPFPPAVEWCRVSLSTPDDMKYFAAKLKEFRRKGWV